jgi:hypothetical protein
MMVPQADNSTLSQLESVTFNGPASCRLHASVRAAFPAESSRHASTGRASAGPRIDSDLAAIEGDDETPKGPSALRVARAGRVGGRASCRVHAARTSKARGRGARRQSQTAGSTAGRLRRTNGHSRRVSLNLPCTEVIACLTNCNRQSRSLLRSLVFRPMAFAPWCIAAYD